MILGGIEFDRLPVVYCVIAVSVCWPAIWRRLSAAGVASFSDAKPDVLAS